MHSAVGWNSSIVCQRGVVSRVPQLWKWMESARGGTDSGNNCDCHSWGLFYLNFNSEQIISKRGGEEGAANGNIVEEGGLAL